MEPVKFSICIPNFNYSKYIDKTIRSILNQEYPHFEIIVADNASSDDSIAVVQSFQDPRIRVLQNAANIGFAPNLDRATEGATGDYLILVSSDDTMKAGALATYARIIEEYHPQHPYLVISSGIDIIDGSGKVTGSKEALGAFLRKTVQKIGGKALQDDPLVEVYHGHDLLKAVFQGSMTNIGKFVSTCYAKPLYDKVGGYKSIMSIIPDAHFSQKLMLQNPTVIFLKKNLFQYRIHAQNFYSGTFSHIKLYCDKYQLSQMYSDKDLAPLGMTQKQVQQHFTQHWFLDKQVFNLLQGETAIGFRAWCFGLAAYPGLMLRHYKCWLMPLLLLLSPFTGWAYRFYKKYRLKSWFSSGKTAAKFGP